MKYKNYNVPDNEIDKLMEKLDISMAEACEIWLSDREMIENETIHELTEMARKNRITATIHEAKGEKKERKAREKKENLLKQSIINIIFNSFVKNLPDAEGIIVRNNEKYIDFTVNGREFTVNLVEHRKKKT